MGWGNDKHFLLLVLAFKGRIIIFVCYGIDAFVFVGYFFYGADFFEFLKPAFYSAVLKHFYSLPVILILLPQNLIDRNRLDTPLLLNYPQSITPLYAVVLLCITG